MNQPENFEPHPGSVNNYEVSKGLKSATGLKKKELADAKKLGRCS